MHNDTEDISDFMRKKVISISIIIIAVAICLIVISTVMIKGTEAVMGHVLIACIAGASILQVIAAVMLLKLYRNIITPLNAVFTSISQIGAASENKAYAVPVNRELSPAVSMISSINRKLNSLISLIENINRSLSFEEVLKYIYTAFRSFVPYEYIGIALIKDDGRTLEAAYGISDGTVKGLPENIYGKRMDICGTSLAKVVQTGNARIINDLEEYTSGKPPRDYNVIIMNAGIRSSITLPLTVGDKPVGIIFFSSTHKDIYTKEHAAFLETLASSIAISFEKNIFVDDLLYSSILALAKLAEARDEETGEHLERMKIYSREIAALLHRDIKFSDEISIEFIKNIERFSPMHDIGKVGVRDSILLKPGRLSAEEFDEMKHHTVYGAEVLKAADENVAKSGRSLFGPGIEIAESHHEKWDGSGYPYGKKGEEIPLSARIVSVADVFDALTSRRPYKEAFPFEKAFSMITEQSGRHFDPEIIRVFAEHKDKIHSIYESLK